MTDDTSPEACRVRFAGRIAAELNEIADTSAQTGSDRKPVMLDQQSVGRLSRMDALQGQAMAKAMPGRRDGRARALLAALERLETGEFGWCDDCGEFIGFPRLELDPAVMRCVSCAR
ncbi:TraR/DksA family transcriptional regulator [Roseobacter ponti]|uniref:TraR/DksA family transcriptional regulator n=1 Tax=Roseobacter ponti TaxID=1891787 RepID=A0A858SZA4_9RHOB|nr:TraR/DksA C4-type zinc finger protein [Roseobacter ponti]QJF53328.1 TraR/DksA family transcriptional regulator [Roseobacter ponti]